MSRHRRFASESSTPARRLNPLSIFSPPGSPVTKDYDKAPTSFEDLARAIDAKKEKLYQEGYLLKSEEVSTSGSRVASDRWEEVYASLTGTILSLWPAKDLDHADTFVALAKVNPTFINITDASITQAGATQGLVISTTGRNRYVFKAHYRDDVHSSEKWLLAMRLSMFERARMQEIYTSNLFLKFHTKDTIDLSSKDEKWAGFVDVRITGGDASQYQWTKMWCSVVSGSKRGFLNKISAKDSQIGEAEVRFYGNKKDKMPEIMMHGVFSAYCTYPEHISLVESAGVIKLEGNVRSRKSSNTDGADGFALIIPSSTDGTKRLSLSAHFTQAHPMIENILKLLMAVWSTFEMYNKPRSLLLNVDHVDALGVSEDFVDLSVDQIVGRIPADLKTEAAWRHALREQYVLQNHYTQVRGKPLTPQSPTSAPSGIFRRAGNERRVLSEGSIVPGPRSLVLSIEEEELQAENLRSARSTKPASSISPRIESLRTRQTRRSPGDSSYRSTFPESAAIRAPLQIVTNAAADVSSSNEVQPSRATHSSIPLTAALANPGSTTFASPRNEAQPFSQRPISQAIHTLPDTKVLQVENPSRMSYAASFGDMRTSTSARSLGSDVSGQLNNAYNFRSPPLTRSETFATEASSITDAQSLIISPHREPIEDSDEDEIVEVSTPQRSDIPLQSHISNSSYVPRPRQDRSSSYVSQTSCTSVYSDGLNPSALDLVREYVDYTTYAQDSQSASNLPEPGQEREGSIYSVNSIHVRDPEVGETKTREEDYQEEFKELAAKLRRRAAMVEALEIPSKSRGTTGLFSNPNVYESA